MPPASTGLPTVDVVVVSWNHESWLPACLASVSASDEDGFTRGTVVVVDNASASPPRPVAAWGDATLLRNVENRGFAAACNQGAGAGRGDLILFLNPDTRLHPRALAAAVGVLQDPAHVDVGCVGLRLLDRAGATQRTCGTFPSLPSITAQAIGLSHLWPARFPGIRMATWPHDGSRDVDFACAAALLVRREVFELLGGFDERLFLYLEDADLSRRARDRGWRTRFCAEAIVEHGWGWSTGGDRAWRLAHSWRSRIVYAQLHLPRLAARVVHAVVAGAAPLARLAPAVARGRWQDARDTLRAWRLLPALLARPAAAVGRQLPGTLSA